MLKAALVLFVSIGFFNHTLSAQAPTCSLKQGDKPNVVFIGADDMNTFAFLKNYPY